MVKKKEDISRSTILVLVFLAVIISVLGTWTVLDAVGDASRVSSNQPQVIQGDSNDLSGGVVAITVNPRPSAIGDDT